MSICRLATYYSKTPDTKTNSAMNGFPPSFNAATPRLIQRTNLRFYKLCHIAENYGDPDGARTRASGLKGRRLSLLTTGPSAAYSTPATIQAMDKVPMENGSINRITPWIKALRFASLRRRRLAHLALYAIARISFSDILLTPSFH